MRNALVLTDRVRIVCGYDPRSNKIVRVQHFSPNLGPIWVRLAGSKSSLEDQERAVSTVEIQ